jgi:N-acetylglucosaminyl-diphospho-decaprenol L-rhamnosyltransferase
VRPDLTLSVISADNLELLLPCLRSVFASTHRVSLEVFVVDNASTDGTAAAVRAEFPRAEFPGVHVLRNETRLGFSTNNNLVLHRGQGRYLMLLNDDTVVLEGAPDHLVDFMDAHPEAGAAGAFLLNADGSFQPAFARFPRPVIEGLWPVGAWSHQLMRGSDRPLEVDSVCGAAMLVRREVIEQVGVLDTAFDPIYSEEVDWCYRIKQAGWRIYACPQAQIVHYGSQTMNRVVPRKYELLLSHKMLFFRKHAGPGAASAYRLSLGISTAGKVLWWTLAGLWPKDRQRSRERRELHWYLLRRLPSL